MAKAASYNVAGNREDLSDILTILEPEVTPVTSMAKKQKASNTTFEWQVDDLQEVEFAGVNEGEDVSAFTNASANRARLGNYIQKFRRTFAVSDIQELTNTAAVSSEFAYAEGKAAREIKRDVEAAICSAQDKQQDGGAGAPYLTRGLFKWLGSGGQPSDVPAAFQSVASSSGQDPLGEDNLNSLLQSLYEANGMPGGQLTLVATPNVKTDISDFARDGGNSSSKSVYRVNQDAESKKITLTVNTYEGDFGMVNVIPSLFLKRSSGSSTLTDHAALLIDPEYIALHQLKAESKTELEDQGGGRRGFCDIICGLACLAPKAHGRIE